MWHSDTAATHRYEVWSRWIWQRITEAKLMWTDEVLGGIWSTWSFIKYEVVKWYWMQRDQHTGWMVPCSLRQCTLKSTWSRSRKGKYAWTFDCLFFSTDGLCRDVDAGVLVMCTKVCLQARNFRRFLLVFHSWGLCVCVFVRNGVVWRIHFILCFFSCFLLLLLFCILQSHYSHFP